MLFYIKTGKNKLADKSKGETVDRIGVESIETNSLHPRTNKRKLREILQKRYGIHPTMLKWAMKQLGWWTPERLGIQCGVARHERYKQGIKT